MLTLLNVFCSATEFSINSYYVIISLHLWGKGALGDIRYMDEKLENPEPYQDEILISCQ